MRLFRCRNYLPTAIAMRFLVTAQIRVQILALTLVQILVHPRVLLLGLAFFYRQNRRSSLALGLPTPPAKVLEALVFSLFSAFVGYWN